MPTYMDIHDIPGATPEDVAKAHLLDQHVQSKHGVEYLKYWINPKSGKVFCLCHAPSAEAADAVHNEAHGLRAARIMEVTPDLEEAFMGASEIDQGGAVVFPDTGERDSGTRTILFTDIVGSTSMTQTLGDDAAMEFLAVHDGIVREAIAANGGREVKHTGDGIMAAFASAASAVRAASAVHDNLARHNSKHPANPLTVRIGIASGEPVEKEKDLFGATVQLASRLCAHAEPGQTLLSNTVAELCLGKSLPLKEVGPVTLKGFDNPVQVHRVTGNCSG
jgi:class 3 adenylate cyclase